MSWNTQSKALAHTQSSTWNHIHILWANRWRRTGFEGHRFRAILGGGFRWTRSGSSKMDGRTEARHQPSDRFSDSKLPYHCPNWCALIGRLRCRSRCTMSGCLRRVYVCRKIHRSYHCCCAVNDRRCSSLLVLFCLTYLQICLWESSMDRWATQQISTCNRIDGL